MLCFILGITMLIFAFSSIIEGLFHFKLFFIAGMIGMVYSIWAIGNFLKTENKKLCESINLLYFGHCYLLYNHLWHRYSR